MIKDNMTLITLHPADHPETHHQKIFTEKTLFPISLMFFIFSLTTYIVINSILFSQSTKATSNRSNNKILKSPYTFASVDDISFIPSKINNFVFDTDQITKKITELYPELSKNEQIKLINNKLFVWTALRETFKTNNLSLNIKINQKIDDIEQIDEEITKMNEEYNKNILRVSGFFFKTRFSGIYPENRQKLKKTISELKPYAKNIIDNYISQAKKYPNSEEIIEVINNDETVLLLNNGELSQSFTDYILDPPLFDDPDFYDLIASTPVNTFSSIKTLKTKNPLQKGWEEYAYVTFFLTQKKGSLMPIPKIVNDYVKKADIR